MGHYVTQAQKEAGSKPPPTYSPELSGPTQESGQSSAGQFDDPSRLPRWSSWPACSSAPSSAPGSPRCLDPDHIWQTPVVAASLRTSVEVPCPHLQPALRAWR